MSNTRLAIEAWAKDLTKGLADLLEADKVGAMTTAAFQPSPSTYFGMRPGLTESQIAYVLGTVENNMESIKRLRALATAAAEATGSPKWEAVHDTAMCDGGGDWTVRGSQVGEILYIEHNDDSPLAKYIAAAGPETILALTGPVADVLGPLQQKIKVLEAEIAGLTKTIEILKQG